METVEGLFRQRRKNKDFKGRLAMADEHCEIPSWYCPFKLDSATLSPFQPLVFLSGLDINGNQVHKSIWETLNSKHTTKDFQPTYITVPLDHKFPMKRTKAENFEGYIPKGILRSNWIIKHSQQIPSSVVVVFDMNWSDPQWNDKKLELAKTVKDMRIELVHHGIQILVLLVRPTGVVDENFSTERASALCAAAEIPPKYLFVLSHTHLERIQACIQRLEIGMRELAKIYYTTRIKKIKGWKDKSTQTPLLVRYNFKIGFFQEVRKDYIAAISHYQAAVDALLSIKITDASVQELKVVASIINYRMCRIHLLKMDAKESKNQFEKHMRSFFKLEGNPTLMFEHLAWIENQYHLFGELLKHHHRLAPNVPDPVSYFMMAASYAGKRKAFYNDMIRDLAPTLQWPPEFEQFKGNIGMLFVGQRPWRADAFGLDNLYTIEDPRAVSLLQYLETLTKHSELIIFHLGIASDFCRELQRGRTRCQLMSEMGVEFLHTKEYSKCIMLMTHVLREFGSGDWKYILYQVADCGLKAACCEGDVPAYCNFLLTLLKTDLQEFLGKERRHLLWTKFESVINGTHPLSEEGYEMNTSRWESSLASPFTSYVEVHKEPILECQAFLTSEVVHIGESVQVKFIIRNRSEFPISVRKYGIRTNIADYKCESDVMLLLQNDEPHELEILFKPLARDVSKFIQVQVAYLDIGKEKHSVLMHYTLSGPITPYLWVDECKKDIKYAIVKIEPSQPRLQIKLVRDATVLLNEWFKITVKWENPEQVNYNRLALGCQLTTSDPSKAVLTVDPNLTNELGTLTHTFELQHLEGTESHSLNLYLKCTNPLESEAKLLVKGRYFDGFNQIMMVEHSEVLNFVAPFDIKQTLTNLQMEKLDSISGEEEFILHSCVQNVSKCTLQLESWKMISNSNNFRVREVEHALFGEAGIILKENEQASFATFVYPLTSNDLNLGHFEIRWKRHEKDWFTSTSDIPVPPITYCDSPLYLRASFSDKGQGKLKQPMVAAYTLFNRTNQVYDVIVSMDSAAESFMNAGPKKVTMKLNSKDYIEFSFILFPLRTGWLGTPKLTIHVPSENPLESSQPLNVHQDSPNRIFISP